MSEENERVKRQDFEHLVREHQSGLLAFLLSLTGNLSDSEDLVQECIVVLWQKFDGFEAGSNFGAWARTTAFFLYRNQSRKAFKQTMTFDSSVLEQLAMEHNRIETQKPPRRHFLSECLGELAEADRELILSRYETGVTAQTLADQAGCKVKSIYNTMARIRQSLAECVRRKTSDDEGDST